MFGSPPSAPALENRAETPLPDPAPRHGSRVSSGRDSLFVPMARRAGRLIAIGGGKGGIGKSLVSSSLGIALARSGRRVVLVDADLGGANLHTCLGVPAAKRGLADFVARRVPSLDDVIVPTGVERLGLICGARDGLEAANPHYQQKQKLVRHLRAIDADDVVLDLGAGTSSGVIDLFLAAEVGILVLLPEPTSVENAYRFARAAFFRRLRMLEREPRLGRLVREVFEEEGGVRTPFALLSRARALGPEVVQRVEEEIARFRLHLVVNQARGPADAEVGRSVATAWRKLFGLELDVLGALPHDDAAWQAVRQRRPVLLQSPDAHISQALQELTRRIDLLYPSTETSP